MNILEALAGTAPKPAARLCKIGRWLAEIPHEAPGRDVLEAALLERDPEAEHYRTINGLLQSLDILGMHTSSKTVQEHRAGTCRCSE